MIGIIRNLQLWITLVGSQIRQSMIRVHQDGVFQVGGPTEYGHKPLDLLQITRLIQML